MGLNMFNCTTVLLLVAIRRYFDSRKHVYREAKPEQQERVEKQQKQRARLQHVGYVCMVCVCVWYVPISVVWSKEEAAQAKPNEKSHWDQPSIEYMSLESSDEEDDGRIIVHIVASLFTLEI